jgi:Putative auto-transporter adhesin, head GIN domain
MRNLLLASALIALVGAANAAGSDAGAQSSRTFAVGPFSAVSLEGSDNVRVVRGPAQSVTATGSQRVLDVLNIRVETNTLKIDRKRGRAYWIRGYDRGAIITVTMPEITAAAVAGSGNMTVDRADGPAFVAAAEGSGNLKVDSIAVKRVALSAQGSGDLTISGTTADATIAAEGSGNINAQGLTSQRATIAVEGSGNIYATVRERATIAVEGSGNVDVTGTDNCAIVKDGSGEARCRR